MRHMKQAAFVGVASLALVAGTAVAADAHTKTVFQGADWVTVYDNATYPGHRRMLIADRECDGNNIFVRYQFGPSNIFEDEVYKQTGCGAANDMVYYQSISFGRINRVKLCEWDPRTLATVKCTAWVGV